MEKENKEIISVEVAYQTGRRHSLILKLADPEFYVETYFDTLIAERDLFTSTDDLSISYWKGVASVNSKK